MLVLRKLKYIIKNVYNILFPLNDFCEKMRVRHLCLFKGKNSIIRHTNFEGRNMIGGEVILNNCSIGYATYVNHRSQLRGSKIGRYCSIADNVRTGFGHHPLNTISTHASFFYDTTSQLGWSWFASKDAPKYDPYKHPEGEDKFITVIGNDVWIGSHAMIMDGIKIGNGAVIGSGAVVTKDVPPYAIVVGVPATVIKYRHPKEIIQKLEESEWWNLSPDIIAVHLNQFMHKKFHIEAIKTE